MNFNISNISELRKVTEYLVSLMREYHIFLLKGDLGAGKTTLVKDWMRFLEVEDEVTSPTFSIINEYRNREQVIYHMDMYRLENIEEALNIGIEEYLFDSGHYNIIEWPELIFPIIKEACIVIEIEANNAERFIKVNEVVLA